jgi:MoaA/NifB/PqqE/SkfB family radical SAM enzyme
MEKQPVFPYIIETHLVDHCNLNCKGCSHFSPLVLGVVFTDPDVYKQDLLRLKRLFRDVYEIRLMGGEPLLHPEINEFIEITRQLFPKTNIAIFTNALLLDRMPITFWETCHDNQVMLKITHYPVPINLKALRQLGKRYRVKVKIPPKITSFNQFLNINGDSDPDESFRTCRSMYICPFLRDGKLYSCGFAPHVYHFNDFFNQNIPISEKDYIEINSQTSAEDILDFLKHPTPLCSYCETTRTPFRWGKSKKDIDEWIKKESDHETRFWMIQKKHAITTYHHIKQTLEMRFRR